jgi:ankyrin repeat domain-containing protein 50
MLGPLHLLAYFNLPIALAGDEQLRNPNAVATALEKDKTHLGGVTSLWLAAQGGCDVAVKELLELPGILVNMAATDSAWTPLMLAVLNRHEGAACLLLDHPDSTVNAVNSLGMTALDCASMLSRDDLGIVKRLLSHSGIVVNVAGDYWKRTPLHYASLRGKKAVVALLLARPDVDVNAQDLEGKTALIVASSQGHYETVKLLLSHPEVEVNRMDFRGYAALASAAECGKERVVRLLLAQPSIQVATQELEAAREAWKARKASSVWESVGWLMR